MLSSTQPWRRAEARPPSPRSAMLGRLAERALADEYDERNGACTGHVTAPRDAFPPVRALCAVVQGDANYSLLRSWRLGASGAR